MNIMVTEIYDALKEAGAGLLSPISTNLTPTAPTLAQCGSHLPRASAGFFFPDVGATPA